MVNTIVDIYYENCLFCEHRSSDSTPIRFSFGKFLNGISIGMNAIIKFCPICGKQYYGDEDWKKEQKTIF